MNLDFTTEQRAFVEAAREFLAAEMPVDPSAGNGREATSGGETGRPAETRTLPAKWPEIASLGWLALGVPESRGGSGGSLVEQALLFRELGRGLAPGPWLGTVLGVEVARRAARDEIATALMEGRATARLAEPWRYPASSVRRDTLGGRFRVVDHAGAAWVVFLGPNGAALVHTSEATCSEMKAVPRSNESVDMATDHPSFSSPTTLRKGMRTSS